MFVSPQTENKMFMDARVRIFLFLILSTTLMRVLLTLP